MQPLRQLLHYQLKCAPITVLEQSTELELLAFLLNNVLANRPQRLLMQAFLPRQLLQPL